MKKRNKLFFKAVLALSIISLVPVFLIGYHVMGVDGRILKNEILQKEQTIATRLASVVRNQVSSKAQFFSTFLDLHTDLGGHDFVNLRDLEYLLLRDSSISYLTVLSDKGTQLFFSGKASDSFNYAKQLSSILSTCVNKGENYIGPVYPHDDSVYVLMAFPVRRRLDNPTTEGVLVAELNLKDLGEALSQAYPLDMDAFVIGAEGQLISYNGAPEGFASYDQSIVSKQLEDLSRALGSKSSGEVNFSNGNSELVAVASVSFPPWKIYVSQSANVHKQQILESIFYSFWDVLLIAFCMILFVLFVSYWVIVPITRPLQKLRLAVNKLQEQDSVVITPEELDIPNNEIGELALGVVKMSSALHSRREELLSARNELAQVNHRLEKRVEERTRELKAATGELVKAERLAAIGQMASIISHEIRNPLAVISNATRLIKMLIPSADVKVTKQFGIIEAEIKQANGIISEVLGYARSRDLMLSTIDLNSYMRDIIASFPVPSGVELKEALDTESVRIKVDAEEIKQAIRNVISNALEALQGSGTITVGTKVGSKVVCIFISDTGVGISEEVRKKMFSPFYTTKARGTGLGLAVVGKAISRHKGKLFINSVLGKGTCFQIYLKIYKKVGDTNYGEAG